MEAIEGHLIDIAMSVVGTALFALIGFVWKISHKVTELQKRLDNTVQLNQKDINQLNKDIDMVMSKVDKHGEWTTNRMMSIAKEMPR
tara:strand:- start:10577 stop:10837 length:261 start_codon:yes stop_codon:yes gene_type:complete